MKLLDQIRSLQQEVGGSVDANGKVAPISPTLFLVEKSQRLQDAIRDKLKQMGYKVLITSEPDRAVDRFLQQPYAGVIVDAGTTTNEGIDAFSRILGYADKRRLPCVGLLIIDEEQTSLTQNFQESEKIAILKRPLTMQRFSEAVQRLIPLQGAPE